MRAFRKQKANIIKPRSYTCAELEAECAKLTKQKEAIYGDYSKIKKQVKEYDTIKWNIDSFLKIDRGQEKKETARE